MNEFSFYVTLKHSVDISYCQRDKFLASSFSYKYRGAYAATYSSHTAPLSSATEPVTKNT